MAGNSANLVDGPARLALIDHVPTDAEETIIFAKTGGLFTNDLDSAAITAFARDLGYTTAACTIGLTQTTRARSVQQSKEPIKERRTGRGATVATSLAEVTLENLAAVLDATLNEAGDSLEPTEASDISEYGLIVDGWAPNELGRRLLLRRCSNTGEISLAYDEANDTVIAVTFNGLKPNDKATWRMVDETLVDSGNGGG